MSARAAAPRGLRRGTALLLATGVALLHLGATGWIATRMPALGDAAAQVQRMDVAFVRELQPTAPPAVAPRAVAPPPAPAPPAARAPARPASTPEPGETPAPPPDPAPADALPVPEPPRVADALPPLPLPAAEPTPDSTALVAAPASETAAQAAPAAPMPPVAAASAAEDSFAWPPSTRLTYRLMGNFRGEVNGEAQVEWIRQGPRYQVHLDVRIGPGFAPLVTRRMSSDGELTAQGLRPSVYEEETKVPFQDVRRQVVRFEPERILLPRGRVTEVPARAWPGVQDAASQFAQFTWLFTTQPQRLAAGATVAMPLALPRSVDRWIYDVIGEEAVATPAGAVPAWHVKPRREARAGGDLTAELWVAPSLQYLPVRILIRQDAETFMDLTLSRLPEQAAR